MGEMHGYQTGYKWPTFPFERAHETAVGFLSIVNG